MNTNEGHNDAASREPIVTLLFSRDDVDGVEEVRLAVLVRCIVLLIDLLRRPLIVSAQSNAKS